MSRFQWGIYVNLDNAVLGNLDVAKAETPQYMPVGMQLDLIEASTPNEYRVRGSVAGSVQNMIVALERAKKDSLRYNWIVEEGFDLIEGILVRGVSREDIDATIDREMFLAGYDV